MARTHASKHRDSCASWHVHKYLAIRRPCNPSTNALLPGGPSRKDMRLSV